MNKIVSLLLLTCLLSCGSTIHYDYDSKADFKAYKTYHYYDDINSGLTILDERRLVRALDAKLQDLGYVKSKQPNFLIDVKGISTEVNNSPSVAVGFGGTGGNTSGGVGVNVPINGNQNYDEMVIEFVDESSGETFWLADLNVILTSSNSPEKRDTFFVALVEKIFSKYTPKPKKK